MSSHQRTLNAERSLLLVIDWQEAFRGKLLWEERALRTAARTTEAAGILGVPVIVTEQYPAGLGSTLAEIAARIPKGTRRFEKTSFSALGAAGLAAHLDGLQRSQIVIIGIETHVCVNQTVHDVLATGRDVHLVRDAISARFALDDDAAWTKMIGSGAVPSTSEAVLFEWLKDARDPSFKSVHKLIV